MVPYLGWVMLMIYYGYLSGSSYVDYLLLFLVWTSYVDGCDCVLKKSLKIRYVLIYKYYSPICIVILVVPIPIVKNNRRGNKVFHKRGLKRKRKRYIELL